MNSIPTNNGIKIGAVSRGRNTQRKLNLCSIIPTTFIAMKTIIANVKVKIIWLVKLKV